MFKFLKSFNLNQITQISCIPTAITQWGNNFIYDIKVFTLKSANTGKSDQDATGRGHQAQGSFIYLCNIRPMSRAIAGESIYILQEHSFKMCSFSEVVKKFVNISEI